MSLFDAERDAGLPAGTVERVRAALEDVSHSPNPHQVFDNLNTDPHIPDDRPPGNPGPASRKEFLSETGTAPHVATAAKAFYSSHRLEGPPAAPSSTDHYGHVARREDLFNALRRRYRDLDERVIRSTVNDLIDVGDVARQTARLAGCSLGGRPMRSTPVEADELFRPYAAFGTRRQDAVDTLGLGHLSPDIPLIRWCHRVPSDHVRVSTAWDAGPSNPYWRPGGFTHNLRAGAPGVREVVHEPTSGDALVRPIEVIPP